MGTVIIRTPNLITLLTVFDGDPTFLMTRFSSDPYRHPYGSVMNIL